MAFGDINRDKQEPLGGGPKKGPKFWFLGTGVDPDQQWGGTVVSQDDDLPVFGDDVVVHDDLDDISEGDWAGWQWCCLKLWIVRWWPDFFDAATGGDPWAGRKKKYYKKNVCVPCKESPNSFPNKRACQVRCIKSPPEGWPPIGGAGPLDGGTTSGDDDEPEEDFTLYYCINETTRWHGRMHMSFIHTFPSTAVFNELIANGADMSYPDGSLKTQEYFAQLCPTSNGIKIEGELVETTSKWPTISNIETREPLAGGTFQGEGACQPSRTPARKMNVQCSPMRPDWDLATMMGMEMLHTSIKFEFMNEYCRTSFTDIPYDDYRIAGPFGGPMPIVEHINPNHCGGSELNCHSEQNYHFKIAQNPDNFDAQYPNDVGYHQGGNFGGPHGRPVEMMLTRYAQGLKGCRPCCFGNSFPESKVYRQTTGAFGAVQFLAWALREVNGQANPGTGVPGFEEGGERSCCRTVIKRAWNTFMVPLVTGAAGYQAHTPQQNHPGGATFEGMMFCSEGDPGSPNQHITPKAHLMKPTGQMFADEFGYNPWGTQSAIHQGLCDHTDWGEPCTWGNYGHGPPSIAGF